MAQLALPESIPVKISSEAAGYLTITPVVARRMAAAELIEAILCVTGKDAARIGEVLRQGSLASGASRFRWTPLEAGREEIQDALRGFPDPQPDRPFDPARCVRAALSGGRVPIELTRQAASRRRWLRRRSFWDALMETAGRLAPVYQHYAYADRADVYRTGLSVEAAGVLREQAGLLRYASLAASLREYFYDKVDLWVER